MIMHVIVGGRVDNGCVSVLYACYYYVPSRCVYAVDIAVLI